MIKDKPFIHLFKTPGGYYVFDVNTNIIMRVQKPVYEFLDEEQQCENKGFEHKVAEEDRILIENMIGRGFLSSKRVSQIQRPMDEILPDCLESKLRMMTLQLTQQYNLRCKYCVYSGNYLNREHSSRRMNFDTATKAIDFFIKHAGDTYSINLGFYGGEPLLEFGLIKKCIEYAEEKGEGKRITFNITTNGTLIDEGTIEYFEAHDISMTISLDGPKEVHDKNRRFAGNDTGTFDRIMENLDMIKAKFPEYLKNKVNFNVVMDPENDFSCANEFFTSYENIKDSLITSAEINRLYSKNSATTEVSDFVEKRNYELFKLFLWNINKLDRKYVSRLVIQYEGNLKNRVYDPSEAFEKRT